MAETALVAGRELDALLAARVMDGELRPYSTDIAAAWLILDVVGGYVKVSRHKPNEWYAALNGRWYWAETAALAICRAAIHAVAIGEARALAAPQSTGRA